MVSSDLRLLRNEQWIFSKVVKISDFRILSGWIEKYKPALSKSDSSWDNSYCVRLVIVSLSVNVGKLYLKFLIFKLPNVSNKDALSVHNRLLWSAINKRNKELQHLSKELSLSENFLSTQVSTIDFYILTKSIISYHKKSLQKSVYTQQKKITFSDERLQLTYIYS